MDPLLYIKQIRSLIDPYLPGNRTDKDLEQAMLCLTELAQAIKQLQADLADRDACIDGWMETNAAALEKISALEARLAELSTAH